MSLYLALFGKPRYLGLVAIDDPAPRAGCWIVVKTVRGLEMALLGGSLSQEQEAKYRSTCSDEMSDDHTRGPEPMLQEVVLVDPAAENQIDEHFSRRSDEENVLVRARQILRDHQLQMKLVDVEYTMDRKKLFFYFTSEQRIDFRAYVRDLAKEFRIRIEMRQIGVRDEAKTVRGISPCGRPCCCSYWLHRFTPINIRMVKEQNLALNPTKISGICGRLMCCMYYEHSTYSELWNSLPSPGSKIKTAQGNYVLEGVDLEAESVKIRFPDGHEVFVSVGEFSNFKETVSRGDVWEKCAPEEQERAVFVKASENSRIAVKNSKKLKPEKMSIEEHLAGRVTEVAEKKPDPVKTENMTTPELRGRKRGKRHKEGAAVPSAPTGQANCGERLRPVERAGEIPKNEQKDKEGDARKTVSKNVQHSRRRSRRDRQRRGQKSGGEGGL